MRKWFMPLSSPILIAAAPCLAETYRFPFVACSCRFEFAAAAATALQMKEQKANFSLVGLSTLTYSTTFCPLLISYNPALDFSVC
jgi:hypothetical protein